VIENLLQEGDRILRAAAAFCGIPRNQAIHGTARNPRGAAVVYLSGFPLSLVAIFAGLESWELARYTAMLVPHQFSSKEGIQYNPEALEICRSSLS